jgi:ABC-2 type transport system permease protein
VKGQPSSYRDIERAIDRRDALMGLVIPSGFGGPAAGRPTSLQLLVDGSDASTAAIAIGYAEGVVRAYGLDTSLEALRRAGARVAERPLDVRPRVLFNEDLESRNYIIPGLIAVIMMVIAALLTSLTVAKEWESGTMEQLVSTPLKGSELILGKLLPYVGIGMLDVLLSVLMGAFVFHVPLRGSVLLLFGMAAIFLVGALSLGMLISIVTKSQLLASQLAMVATFLPAFLLSGFMYDIDNMPRTLRLITLAVPARYFVALLKGIYLKGVGLDVLTFEAGLLVVFAAAMLGLANVKFQKKLV